MKASNPLETLSNSLAHAAYMAFDDVEYQYRDQGSFGVN